MKKQTCKPKQNNVGAQPDHMLSKFAHGIISTGIHPCMLIQELVVIE